MEEIAKQFYTTFVFTWCHEPHNEHRKDKLGISHDNIPAIALNLIGGDERYVFNESQ